jgi:hypothetical protein
VMEDFFAGDSESLRAHRLDRHPRDITSAQGPEVEKEISHSRMSWQSRRIPFGMGLLASSIG